MIISEKQKESFTNAVSNPENIQSNGHVNWNGVDADFYMDLQPIDGEAHYQAFEQLATDFEAINGVQHMLKSHSFIGA